MDMKQGVQRYLQDWHKPSSARKKLSIDRLEETVKQQYGDMLGYQRAGGYGRLYQVVVDLVDAGKLEPVKSARGNGRQPELLTMYWLLPDKQFSHWNDMDMIRLSDRLDLSVYRRQPELQTEEEWGRLERVYSFLCGRGGRAWVTREERSLELFGHEKWLSEEQGMQLLRRLGLTLEDLLAKVHGEPFVFWPVPGGKLQEAREALIVENLSLFHTIRRVLEKDGSVSGLRPELLIYGEGKKIEASLSFLKDITDATQLTLRYAGDIDPEGWGIYIRLRRKYPEIHLKLAIPLYEAMVRVKRMVPIGKQAQQEEVLALILEELEPNGSQEMLSVVEDCWIQQRRIPQEVLTVEILRAGKEGIAQ